MLAPGALWHYSNLAFALLGEVVARAHGGTLGGGAAGARARPARPRADDAARRRAGRARLLRRAVHATRVRLEPDLELGGAGALGQLWSTTGDLARWGAFLAAGDDRVLEAATLEEMAHVHAMVDHERWTLGLGPGLELFRRGDRVFAGHGGAMPGLLAALVVNRKTGSARPCSPNTGAGAEPEELALELAVAALEALPPVPEAWRAGASRRRRRSSRCSGAGGPRATSRASLAARAASRRSSSAASPGRDVSFRARRRRPLPRVEGRERGELLRVVRDEEGAVEKLYFATYPLRRSPRRSSGRRRGRRRSRRRRRRRSGSRP